MNDYVGEIPIGNNVRGTFSEGWTVGGAFGLEINDRWRLEQEFTYRNNSGNFWQNTTIPWDGRMNNYGTATNLYRDFGSGRIQSYLGGGAGFAYQKGELAAFGIPYEINNWAFAYQVMLGVNYATSRNNDLYMEYRYYANTRTNVRVFGSIADNFDYETGNLLFGIRFKR